MSPSFDIWKMLAGVAFFLLAMKFMEDSLRQLAGRSFKLFLKKQTKNKVKAIGAGAVVTGFLQSSSIVNLLVLSMVGASVVKMENALAIILGSNLGTTLDSWLVATLGFNFNIESFALPVAGITGIGMAFSNNDSKWFLWLKFLFSLAFLFIALGFIKTGMEGYVKQTDLSSFTQYPLIVFLLLGVFLTTIIQSSSATIALTLSALYTDAITLYMATAIVLGSEIGTTFKLFLASAKGLTAKKRVALGNFLFNLVTVSIMFLLLRPVNHLITSVLHIKDNLIALVFFQSFVNIFSIAIFFPFLKLLSQFLMKRYVDKEDESIYISKVPVSDPELAMEALESETNLFINHVIDYSLDSFSLEEIIQPDPALHKSFLRKTVAEKYEHIKQSHGEMHAFYLKLRNAGLHKAESERLEQLISAIRNMMYAAKNIRDAQHDIEQIRSSSNDVKYNFYEQSRDKMLNFYRQVQVLIGKEKKEKYFEDVTILYHSVTAGYSETLQQLYKQSMTNRVSEIEISTLINFNRELYTSFKSVLFGLKDFLLTTREAEYFDALPGFIR
jgi:phosphate:Na+ symporter